MQRYFQDFFFDRLIIFLGNVYPVALLGLIPEDEPLLVVANAFGAARIFVVLEQERLRARPSGVPLVTLSRVRPVVLVVAGRAAALAPERFSGIFFEDDKFSERAWASAADLFEKVVFYFVFQFEGKVLITLTNLFSSNQT